MSTLTPTTQEEIHRKSPARIWDIRAARILDCEKIRAHIKEAARGKIKASVSAQTNEQARLQKEAAIAKYKLVSDALEKMYDPNQMAWVDEFLEDAERGTFKREAPTQGTILMWVVLLLLAGGLELSFFSYMVIAMGAGPALIGLAVLLLVGGIFTGDGIASMMIKRKQDAYEEREHEAEGRYQALTAVGLVLIGAVTILRFVFGGSLAGTTAALFGIAVTTTEAFVKFYRGMRRYFLDLMFRAQQCYAAVQLEIDIQQRGNPDDDSWREHYIQHIEDAIAHFRTAAVPKDDLPDEGFAEDRADDDADSEPANNGTSAAGPTNA